MARSLTVISSLQDDVELGMAFAGKAGIEFNTATELKIIKSYVVGARPSIVLWNIDPAANLLDARELLAKSVSADRLIALCETRLNEYPQLLSLPIYNHHFVRNSSATAQELYFGVMNCILEANKMPTLPEFLGDGTKVKKLTIEDSRHKLAAALAIEKHLKQLGIAARLAQLISQAVDELVLNAIFDAPVKDGMPSKWHIPRHKPIKLEQKEVVEIDMAATDHSIALSVTDQFGSLRKANLMNSLSEHYARMNLRGASNTASGMGLRGIYNAGLSLHCAVKPNYRTRITIFCPRTSSFKEFRQGAQFLSINFDD